MSKVIISSLLLAWLPLTCPAQEDKRDSQPAAAGAAKPDAADSGDAKEEKADAGAKSALAGVPGMTQYIIGPEDVLFVKVWREPDLSGQMMVRPDGKISLPLVNEVEASGKTPEELAKHIASGLSKYMNQPEVSVMVQAVNSKFYFIQGEVLKPGKYPLLVPTTVLQALVNAGGFQEFANRKKIVVMRGDERHKFNYNDVIKGKKSDQNIVLHSGDLIVVP